MDDEGVQTALMRIAQNDPFFIATSMEAGQYVRLCLLERTTALTISPPRPSPLALAPVDFATTHWTPPLFSFLSIRSTLPPLPCENFLWRL
jgi:hypothetical protein